MFFRKKKKQPEAPYIWKEGEGYRYTYKEYRYFHGFAREWGKVKTLEDGTLEWHYVYYHPFRSFVSISDSCTEVDVKEEDVPVWFIQRLQRAEIDRRKETIHTEP